MAKAGVLVVREYAQFNPSSITSAYTSVSAAFSVPASPNVAVACNHARAFLGGLHKPCQPTSLPRGVHGIVCVCVCVCVCVQESNASKERYGGRPALRSK